MHLKLPSRINLLPFKIFAEDSPKFMQRQKGYKSFTHLKRDNEDITRWLQVSDFENKSHNLHINR